MNSIKPKTLFLIDGIGALLSAFMLGIVLSHNQELIGLPLEALHILAVIPLFFAAYSLFHYFKFPKNWKPFLKAIAVANILYCVLTFTLIIYFREEVLTLGYVYFFLETIFVLCLVSLELKR